MGMQTIAVLAVSPGDRVMLKDARSALVDVTGGNVPSSQSNKSQSRSSDCIKAVQLAH